MKEQQEKDVTLQELKDLIFNHATNELDGYIKAREKNGEETAEVQRQRYVAIFQIIDGADLYKEYSDYKNKIKK